MKRSKSQKNTRPNLLWGARFSQGLDQRAKEFSYSLGIDQELLGSDIKVSMAHALMLGKTGLISEKEAKTLVKGLWQVLAAIRKMDLQTLNGEIEDIHTLIQNTLEEKVGKLARKLHTARSRNDLVATSTRVYVKEKIPALLEGIIHFQSALVELADRNSEVLIPGYTHLQRAQTVMIAHHLLAYVEMLSRDRMRIVEYADHLSECPLGSGALAGSGLPIDRAYAAKLLGFSKPTANSMDSVSDRDFVVELLSIIAILMMHLSRFSEDLILWNSSEFGFIVLADEFSTGSSLMPHKKNPDMFELVKGKTGEAYGNLLSVLTMMKGLALTYNRDMQEDKKPLFQSICLAETSLKVLVGIVSTLRVNKRACENAVKDSFLYATDVLEYLVNRKVAFKDAHEIVGKLVRSAHESRVGLSELKFETFKKFSNQFGKDVFRLFNPRESVKGKVTLGSTNPRLVKTEISRQRKELKNELAQLKRSCAPHA